MADLHVEATGTGVVADLLTELGPRLAVHAVFSAFLEV